MFEHHRRIEQEHLEEVQEAFEKLPQPSRICAPKLPEGITVELSQAIEAAQDPSQAASQPMEVEPVSSGQVEVDVGDVEMQEETDVQSAQVDEPTEEVVTTAPKRSNISSLITAAAKAAASLGVAAGTSAPSEPKKKKSPAKVVQSPALMRLKKQEALGIDCPITKYPTAVRMQTIESFLLDTEEREIQLASRSIACKRKEIRLENFLPEHVYNLASPEMPEPKEKRFEPEYSESFQDPNVRAFEDMPFCDKSKCWNTAYSCRVRLYDLRSVERLIGRLDKCSFCPDRYGEVIDQRFSEVTPTQLLLDVSEQEFQKLFDSSPNLEEDEMMCAFGMKPTAGQLDIVLAYFELKSSDLEVHRMTEDGRGSKQPNGCPCVLAMASWSRSC